MKPELDDELETTLPPSPDEHSLESEVEDPEPPAYQPAEGLPYRPELSNLSKMYQTWFLDYASYVILERAVPHIDDGSSLYSAVSYTTSSGWIVASSSRWLISSARP